MQHIVQQDSLDGVAVRVNIGRSQPQLAQHSVIAVAGYWPHSDMFYQPLWSRIVTGSGS
jgi:hypothetical protein